MTDGTDYLDSYEAANEDGARHGCVMPGIGLAVGAFLGWLVTQWWSLR